VTLASKEPSACAQFVVEAGGSLVLIDWFTSGRAGRGEEWAFSRLESTNRVTVGGRLILLDPLVLDPTDGGGRLAGRMGGFGCYCLGVMVGPRAQGVVQSVMAQEGRKGFADGGVAAATPYRADAPPRVISSVGEPERDSLSRGMGEDVCNLCEDSGPGGMLS
jgi:hypothetical protein